MLELGDLYLKIVEAFAVTFSLIGQVFKHRPWMIPLIPVAGMVIYFGARMRRQSEARPTQDRRAYPRR